MWILNLPLGWMNERMGSHVTNLIGTVVKLDVDIDEKASGAFLHGCVSIEIEKPHLPTFVHNMDLTTM